MSQKRPLQNQPAQYTVLRFMSRFSCIGAACEDNCCHGWNVSVAQDRLAQIRKVLKNASSDLERFNAAIELMPAPERRRDSFARFRMRVDGCCPMLDEERLCSLQRGHGLGALPEICASFPRQTYAAPGRPELTASLACPEVARLVLLSADSTDIVELDAAAVGDAPAPVDTNPGMGQGPTQAFDRLRRRMHALLGRDEYSLERRLYFMLELANQLQQLTPDGAKFHALLDAFEDPELLQELDERFGELRSGLQLDLLPVIMTTGWCRAQDPNEVFARLSLGILRSYDPDRSQTDGWMNMAQLTAEYRRRREAVLGAFGERVDLYVRNRARHLWFDRWPLRQRDVSHYVRGLMLQLAVLRFLLISHPEAALAAKDPAGGQATLDRLAVQLFYAYSRMVDSNRGRVAQQHNLINEQVPDLAAAIRLLAV